MAASGGRLSVVATPIGNLGDLTPRARETLAVADLIAAEDTRRTQALLNAIGVSRPLISLHGHNEPARAAELIEQLRAGRSVALVSDAGTPVLSDPGAELVQRALDAGFEVQAVPGASAIVAALSIAGLDARRFCFEGFLPARARERQRRLQALAHEPRTMVFFEAPHRCVETLRDMQEVFGAQRRAAVARELTKVHETTYRGTLAELGAAALADANFARGELTFVVAGEPQRQAGATLEEAAASERLLQSALRALLTELPPSKAAALAAQIAGVRRSVAYETALRLVGKDAGATSRGGD